MANFAKIFQLDPINQVLVTVAKNEAKKLYQISQITVIDEIEYCLIADFNTEDDVNKCFDDYTQENAYGFFDYACEFIEKNGSDPSEHEIIPENS